MSHLGICANSLNKNSRKHKTSAVLFFFLVNIILFICLVNENALSEYHKMDDVTKL